MKISIKLEGDENVIGAFIGGGLREANAASATPVAQDVLVTLVHLAFKNAIKNGGGHFLLGEGSTSPQKRSPKKSRRKRGTLIHST